MNANALVAGVLLTAYALDKHHLRCTHKAALLLVVRYSDMYS